MDRIHRLNEAEIADALAGKPAEERIATCEVCSAEFSTWKEMGAGLRCELDERAELPAYLWTRQRARIRERLAPRAVSLNWAAAAILALVLLALGLVRQGAVLRNEILRTAPAPTAQATQQADPDDLLLQNVETSLDREVPAPLAPAAMLVEEMASASNQAQQAKEN